MVHNNRYNKFISNTRVETTATATIEATNRETTTTTTVHNNSVEATAEVKVDTKAMVITDAAVEMVWTTEDHVKAK